MRGPAEKPFPLDAAGITHWRKEVKTRPRQTKWKGRVSSPEYLTLHSTSRSFRAFSALMKTFSAKAHDVQRKWWVIDARNQVLGQVATKAANCFGVKGRTIFTRSADAGDFGFVFK